VAVYGRPNIVGRIIVLILLIFVLAAGGMLWFDTWRDRAKCISLPSTMSISLGRSRCSPLACFLTRKVAVRMGPGRRSWA
jgi:hypothetical protein